MLLLRFDTRSLWRDCCDAPHMRRKWGEPRALRISRRLQQLEAMTSLADLQFMPFDSVDADDGSIDIAIDHDTALTIRIDDTTHNEEHAVNIVTVLAVNAHRTVAS